MLRRLQAIEARVLPRGVTDLATQGALFLSAFLLYDLVRGISVGQGYAPFGNAMKIIDLERVLHVFVEPSIQDWASNNHWLMAAADWTYLNAHFFLTVAALAFMYVRRNDSFYFVRNMFMISMGLALIGYALFPTAPPRLMPEWGFTDSVSQFMTGGTTWWDFTPGAKAFLNGYAAVPSMHVCFAVMIGWTMVRLVRSKPAKLVWCAYPLLITFVVVATANHYFTDVVLGAMTAAVSATLAHGLLARAKPQQWAFEPAAA